jgi:hypothetical protein
MESPLHIVPFSIHIEAKILSDLRERIRKTRWPDQAPGAAWEQGTDLEYLRQLLAYWADEFDWLAQERELNAATQFRAELDGVHIHFVHERAIAAGLDPARMKQLPELGRMTPGVWYFLPKGQLDPHHAHAMPAPTIAIAVNVKSIE